MSKKNKRPDHVQNSIYNPFLGKQPTTREAILQNMHMKDLTELAVHRFKWVGLPETVDARFLELTLFFKGLAVFYFDEEFDRYMALRGTGVGTHNMYDNPTKFKVYGNTMVSKELLPSECVPVWNNFLRQPDVDRMQIYARRLAEIDRTIEINIKQMRVTTVISVPEEQRLTYQNIVRQIEEGSPVIYGSQNLSSQLEEGSMQAFNLGMNPDLVPKTMVARSKMWNEIMTSLGIDNANQDKRERLVADEVQANNAQILAHRQIVMDSRKRAAEDINRMFPELGGKVDVMWNMDVAEQAQDILENYGTTTGDTVERSGEENADFHS